jgi:hypothetical protein
VNDVYTPETDGNTTGNGTKDGAEGRKARVRFGPKAHQTVPHEWAERMLMRLFQTNRAVFGKTLQHAAGVADDE